MTWFQGIPGRVLLYPCAGSDWLALLDAFGDHIDEFIFVDLYYQFSELPPIAHSRWQFLPGHSVLTGPSQDNCRSVEDGAGHWREIEPAWLREKYQDAHSGRTIQVTRRRGFGQYALNELPDGSLGIFCHRGDSMGEGGSNTYFLSNRTKRHPLLSNLFDKIKRKFVYPALIVSDGSNTFIRRLKKAATAPKNSLIESIGMTEFVCYGLRWQRVGELNSSSINRSIVWRVDHV